jgi:hypothetical protein
MKADIFFLDITEQVWIVAMSIFCIREVHVRILGSVMTILSEISRFFLVVAGKYGYCRAALEYVTSASPFFHIHFT